MPNFGKEFAYPVQNAGQEHLACTILVDTSSSMRESLCQLNNALKDFNEALNNNARARVSVEVSLITFDSTARVALPFCPVHLIEFPELTAQGMTSMHAAVGLALKEDRRRKELYKKSGTGHHRSWFFLLSDGAPNDESNGEFEDLIAAQKAGSVNFYAVGIGEHADTKQLASLSVNESVIVATRENFEKAFLWLSNSLSKVSQSRTGTRVSIDNPEQPEYGGLQYKQISVIS